MAQWFCFHPIPPPPSHPPPPLTHTHTQHIANLSVAHYQWIAGNASDNELLKVQACDEFYVLLDGSDLPLDRRLAFVPKGGACPSSPDAGTPLSNSSSTAQRDGAPSDVRHTYRIPFTLTEGLHDLCFYGVGDGMRLCGLVRVLLLLLLLLQGMDATNVAYPRERKG